MDTRRISLGPPSGTPAVAPGGLHEAVHVCLDCFGEVALEAREDRQIHHLARDVHLSIFSDRLGRPRLVAGHPRDPAQLLDEIPVSHAEGLVLDASPLLEAVSY